MNDFERLLARLARPAQRALLNAGITSLEQLAAMSEKEVMALHGIGKHALHAIGAALQANERSFAPPYSSVN